MKRDTFRGIKADKDNEFKVRDIIEVYYPPSPNPRNIYNLPANFIVEGCKLAHCKKIHLT